MNTSLSRRDELMDELRSDRQHLIARLAEDPCCRRAILFGSLASADVGEPSDIDLIIIQDTAMPFWQLAPGTSHAQKGHAQRGHA